MRRSEALKIITDIISEVTYENLAEKRAERILTKLEEAGMLPPLNENNYHYEDREDTYICNAARSCYFIWEPE